MQKTIAAVLAIILVVLALLPWVVRATRPQPLLPEELRQARQHYEATVEAAQDGTITAIRQATSVPNIRIIGTVAGGATVESRPEPAPMPEPTLETIIIVVQNTLPATEPPPASTLPPEATAIVGATESTLTNSVVGGPPLPATLIPVEDTITEVQLAEQIRLDAGSSTLPNLSLTITPDGIRAASVVTIFPGIEQQIEAGGVLDIENYGLVFRAEYVQLNGEDVSARYRESLESQINTSLYRLLPGRFVQSYALGIGEIRVQSGVRP